MEWGLRRTKRKILLGEAWSLAMDWWNVTIKIGKEKCPEEKWSGVVPQWTRDIKIFGEICVGLNLGKQKKIWNKGFDGVMVGHSHKSSIGVHGTHNLNTGKTHDTRNVQWMGKMCKECAKEDAVNVEDSANSDSTSDKAKENDERNLEEEPLGKWQR